MGYLLDQRKHESQFLQWSVVCCYYAQTVDVTTLPWRLQGHSYYWNKVVKLHFKYLGMNL